MVIKQINTNQVSKKQTLPITQAKRHKLTREQWNQNETIKARPPFRWPFVIRTGANTPPGTRGRP